MDQRKRRKLKNKKKTAVRLAFLAGILIVIAAGILAALLLLKQEAVAETPMAELPFGANDNYTYTGSGFFYVTSETLYNDDLYNERNDYSIPIGSAQYDFTLVGSPTIQLYHNSGAIQIIGREFPIEFANQLLSVRCGISYIAALRSDGSGTNDSIQIFDAAGNQHDQINAEGQFILDYGFYGTETDYLYVVAMSTDASLPVTTITLYSVANKATNAINQVQSQLIEKVYFGKLGMYAVGTNQILRYALADSREMYTAMVYGYEVMDFDASASTPGFLLRPRSGSALGTIKLLQLSDGSAANETGRIMQLPTGTLNAFLMNGKLIAVTANGYIQYDMSGKQTGTFRFAAAIEEAQKLDSSYLLLRSGATLYTVKIS